jgi:hypothetical protein
MSKCRGILQSGLPCKYKQKQNGFCLLHTKQKQKSASTPVPTLEKHTIKFDEMHPLIAAYTDKLKGTATTSHEKRVKKDTQIAVYNTLVKVIERFGEDDDWDIDDNGGKPKDMGVVEYWLDKLDPERFSGNNKQVKLKKKVKQ